MNSLQSVTRVNRKNSTGHTTSGTCSCLVSSEVIVLGEVWEIWGTGEIWTARGMVSKPPRGEVLLGEVCLDKVSGDFDEEDTGSVLNSPDRVLYEKKIMIRLKIRT